MKFPTSSDTYPCELCGSPCVGASAMSAVCDVCPPNQLRQETRHEEQPAKQPWAQAVPVLVGAFRQKLAGHSVSRAKEATVGTLDAALPSIK
jgi:hypothetical protein